MQRFASNPRVKSALITSVLFLGILIVTQIILPGGSAGGGTPPAVLFNGLVLGLLQGLVAAGIVLIYRSSNIINFAQGALGAAGGVFTYNFAVLNRWPFLLSLIMGLIVAALIGLAVELGLMRRFLHAPRLVLTVVTIALIGVLAGAAQTVSGLPGLFPDRQDRTVEELSGSAPIPLPFSGFKFRIGSLPLDFGFPHLLAIGLSIVALIGLSLFLRYTRFGIAIRAAAENAERAPLLGINIGILSMIVWTIAGFLSGLGLILTGVANQSFTGGSVPPELLITALAAALIARMRKLWVAVAAATAITILRQAINYSFADQIALLDVGLLLVVVGGLLAQRSRAERSEAQEVSSWKATEEYRPIPKEMLAIPGLRAVKFSGIVIGLLTLLLFPWAVSSGASNLAGYVFIVAISMLSLVVLTGWAGQVSLGQWGLVAVAAVLGGAATSRMGISFWIAIIIVPVLVGGMAFLLGIPALRIRGLYLAVTTFAFAFAVRSALFNDKYFSWLLPQDVDRPSLFLFDFEDERSMYYLVLIALVLAIVIVITLRRSRVGRVLIALRENEPNVQSFGVNAIKTRLSAFALSGWLCGFAGVLLAHHQRAAQGTSFDAVLSLQIFLFAVVGGVGSVSGVLLGAGFFAVRQSLAQSNPTLAFFVGDIGILAILFLAPGGLASIVYGFRDSVLRIVAQRRQMIVPSLFADIDPEAMKRKLIPLAEPIPNAGIAALPYDRRYRTTSSLYGRSGWTSLTASQEAKKTGEAVALGAAAEALQTEEELAQ